MRHLRNISLLLVLILSGKPFTWGQGTIIDSGSPTNKWILHNPEDFRKTLFVAPLNNSTWDWGAQTQFRSNGDVLFSGKVGVGIPVGSTPTETLDVNGNAVANYLRVRPQGGGEGGEINLMGGAGNADWNVDAYNESLRMHSGGAAWFTISPNQVTLNSTDIKAHGHLSLYAFEGDSQSGTAYVQARDQSGSSNLGLRLRTQNAGQIVETMHLTSTGNVGIGTINPGNYKLAVEGKIGAREVDVKTGSWADFVFAKNYVLPALSDVERHIQVNKHLPGIPSEADVKKNGYSLGEMDAKLLQKIEELTLYVIEQQKRIERLERRLDTKIR